MHVSFSQFATSIFPLKRVKTFLFLLINHTHTDLSLVLLQIHFNDLVVYGPR